LTPSGLSASREGPREIRAVPRALGLCVGTPGAVLRRWAALDPVQVT
jgi:hypothetical protein